MAARRGRVRRGQQGLLTILFTDLEGSTAMTQRLGDARAQEIVRAHNAIVRREVTSRGGNEVKHTGDGIMATFNSAARAVAAAVAMQQASRVYNDAHPETAFNIGVGLNAGEPVAEDADVFGSAVQLASRTCAQAKGGQILATNVVRELVYGKGALFADVGSSELKGFPEPVHLFEVSAGAGGIDEGDRARARGMPLRMIGVGAVIVAIVVAVGAAALASILSSGGDGEGGEPQYREIRVRASQSGQPFEITGDCTNTPVVLTGRAEGPFTGDISGVSTASYEARYSLADKCTSLTVSALSTSELDDGSSFTSVTLGFSLNVIGRLTPGSATSQADIVMAAIIPSGTGVYADVAGRGVCRTSALRNQVAGQEGISYENDCSYKLAPASSLPPVIVEAIANSERVSTQLTPSGRGDTFKILLLYFNARDEQLSGLSARLPVPAGAQTTSLAGEGDAMAGGLREWELPDLAPGEVANFEITVRLLSAEEDFITLLPQIALQGRKHTFKSDPIVIAVER